MTSILWKLFIEKNVSDDAMEKRRRVGVVSGAVGIACNVLLFLVKLLAGLWSASVSVLADAFNNLSDASSSFVTLFSFKLAGRPPDPEHPYGHGRYEYIAGFLASIFILWMGLALFKTSITKIFQPEALLFSPLTLGILLFSILVKLWMGLFYNTMGGRIHSATLRTMAKDSLGDVAATFAVAISLLLYHWLGWNIDGWAGCVVAGLILFTGFEAAKETMSPLLGQAPDPALIAAIEAEVRSFPIVLDLHDLMIHSYGPEKKLLSLHAEVCASGGLVETHHEIDRIERSLKEKFGCDAVIHIDPVQIDDERLMQMRKKVGRLVEEVAPGLTIHDFRMQDTEEGLFVWFDITAPYACTLTDTALRTAVLTLLSTLSADCQAAITIDRADAE